jgi:hypothetical protein
MQSKNFDEEYEKELRIEYLDKLRDILNRLKSEEKKKQIEGV